MKRNDLVLKLRLDSSIGRANLAGILQTIRSSDGWNIRIAGDNADFARYAPDAAAIVADASADEAELATVLDRGVPTVLIHGRQGADRAANLGFVFTDNGAVGFAAADYLLSLGRFRTYAYVPARERSTWSEKRGRAFACRLRERHVSCKVFNAAKFEVLPNWLRSLPKPAAVFCAWDRLAVEVIAAAAQAGIDIPTQLSVLGADNADIFCTSCHPQLSSIDFGAEAEGVLAIELLRTLIGKHRRCQPKVVFGKIQRIVERESTRTPPPCAKLVEDALRYIREHAADGIAVRDVVAHLGVSRTLADRRFREMGVGTIGHLLTAARLDVLAARIRRSRQTLASQIANSGFHNANHAKTIFRKRFGMTMRDWRNAAPTS